MGWRSMKFRHAVHLQWRSAWKIVQKVSVNVQKVVTTRGAVHVPNVGENVSDSAYNVALNLLVTMTIASHAMTMFLHVIRKLI